jgi:hypothetical protein
MDTLKYILFNIPSILCVISAAYLLYCDKEGWGWFLFVAVLLAVAVPKC